MHDILMEEDILAENDSLAAENRRMLKERGIFTINMVSSPGAGKTAIIERMPERLRERLKFAVLEGDLATDLDSKRIERHGVAVKQITTGRACHLDAHQVGHALPWVWGLGDIDLLVIENVGNMVCPAEYDLGEDLMAAVMSVTEGDDKPLKYPPIFSKADILVINKIDLLPFTDFDLKAARDNALKINPALKVFELSCRTGEGLDEWCGFVARSAEEAKARKGTSKAASGK